MMTSRNDKPVDRMIVETIVRRITPKRVILFGSRARSDAQERSDYDIAIDDDRLNPRLLAQIRDDIESIPTLLRIEVVWLNRITDAFRRRILSEGKVLYEHQS